MNFDKLKETIDSIGIIEELVVLSGKIFDKSSDDAKKVIEMLIAKSYLMGKKNMIKAVSD